MTRTATRRPTWHSHAASNAQLDAIARTRTRKVITQTLAETLAAFDLVAFTRTPSKGEASTVLDLLFAAEWLPRPAATPPVDERGTEVEPVKWDVFRTTDERIVKIEKSRSAGNLYGVVLDEDTGAWDYLRGFRHAISGARRLTLDEAAALSARWERCVRCNRKITAQESLDRGMGPICANYFTSPVNA